ncbi:ATP-dependent DNA helicase PIF1 [Choanephora cucurbitarum]|uniref:ATP-dependent DNA helicase n=1 Tax=Choanephora cucurbitarum TaxID=101091 RepID=A0A1C7NM55_9FUNG|nr:ATP-dependent DNA helicase PIF1 [Choanephora cucurbitarum]
MGFEETDVFHKHSSFYFLSFAKLGSGDHTVTESVERILMSDVAERLWLRARVLIIDEISMIDGSLLDKVEKIARNVRQKQARFGGIQVIMSGDFFQLPPVNRETDAKLAFEAKCWNTVVDKCFILKHCFRQKDSKLVEILNQIRVGYVSEEAEEIFKSLSRTPKANHGIIPTELYPLAHEVCRANRNRLSAINSDAFIFKAVDKGNKGYLDTIRAPLTLELKVGAQVMLIKNLSPVLVNGSLGVVTKFTEEKDSRTYPVVKFTNGIERVMYPELWSISVNGSKVLAYRQQVPLILAWALSIHKSQGQTIEYVKVDLANIFERGHAYVALSRSVTMDNLQILNFDKEKIRVNEKAAEFYKRIES